MRGDCAYCQTSACGIPLESRELLGKTATRSRRACVVNTHRATGRALMAQNSFRGADLARTVRQPESPSSRRPADTATRVSPRSRRRGKRSVRAAGGRPPPDREIGSRPGQSPPSGRGDGGCGVRPAECGRILAGELRIQPPVVQDHEAETVGLERGALAYPAIVVGARRIAEPIARHRKSCDAALAAGCPRDTHSCRSRSRFCRPSNVCPKTGRPAQHSQAQQGSSGEGVVLVCAAACDGRCGCGRRGEV